MSADDRTPREFTPDEIAALGAKHGVGLDHHSKIGEPHASAFAGQLAAPGFSAGFRRMEWAPWFVDTLRSGSLGARATHVGEFVPDWDARDSLAVQQSLAALAEVDPTRPTLLVTRPYVKARFTGFDDGDESLVEEFGRSDTDIRDEVHNLVVPYGTSVERLARLVEREAWIQARDRGVKIACDRCVSPGPFEHVEGRNRRPVVHDAPLFLFSVGMVHIPVVLCNRHAAMLRAEAKEAGVELTEVPPLDLLPAE